jgi:hypothetical protein
MLEAEAKRREKLARIYSILLLGDNVSTYLVLLYGHVPSSMGAIEELKRE